MEGELVSICFISEAIRYSRIILKASNLTGMAQESMKIAFPKCFFKPSSQTKSFSVTYINVILTLQLRPHAYQKEKSLEPKLTSMSKSV